MDAMVVAAMAKWPNVPAVFGWLALSARGEWRLKGERVAHPGLSGFFGRNYEHDQDGRYFVQNGPQRIFVALQAAPYAARRGGGGWQRLPDGFTGPATAAFLTPHGELLLEIGGGLALLDDHEWSALADALQDAQGAPLQEPAWDALLAGQGAAVLALPEARLTLELVALPQLLARFGVQADPQP